MINKPIDIKLKNLFEKVELTLDRQDLADAPVFFGGPVQTERGFVLHERWRRGDGEGTHYNSTLQIPGGLEMTTSKDVLEDASGAGPKKVLVTLGYSGWGAGQLEDEIGRNGWLTVRRRAGIIFDTPVEQRYEPRSRCWASTRACSARRRARMSASMPRAMPSPSTRSSSLSISAPARRRGGGNLRARPRPCARSPPKATRASPPSPG